MSVQLADANVWVALAIREHRHEAAVHGWLDTVDSGSSVLFCRSTQQTFLRLMTTEAVMALYGRRPLTNEEAWVVYLAFLNDGRIDFLGHEPAGLEGYWREYAVRQTSSPKLWPDAYLAAFARAGGYRLVTTDTAFRQFSGLDLLLLGDSPAA